MNGRRDTCQPDKKKAMHNPVMITMTEELRSFVRHEVAYPSPCNPSYYEGYEAAMRRGGSFYSKPGKSWNHTPEGCLRVSDHWNFHARGSEHAITDRPVPRYSWAIGRYQGGIYTIEKIVPFQYSDMRKAKLREMRNRPRMVHDLLQRREDHEMHEFLNRYETRSNEVAVFSEQIAKENGLMQVTMVQPLSGKPSPNYFEGLWVAETAHYITLRLEEGETVRRKKTPGSWVCTTYPLIPYSQFAFNEGDRIKCVKEDQYTPKQ